MKEKPTILLANPDESVSTVLAFNLERYGFIVSKLNKADNFFTNLKTIAPNVIVLDENIVRNHVQHNFIIDFCSKVKNNGHNRIYLILLTGDKSQYNQQRELMSYIDALLVKPFAPSELVAKIRSFFTKVSPIKLTRSLEYKDLKMNMISYQVTRSGRRIHLGPKEFKILQCLMELPSKILSREHIMQYVWGYSNQVEPRTVDVHINRLRSALKNDNESDASSLIRTVRSAGYSLSS